MTEVQKDLPKPLTDLPLPRLQMPERSDGGQAEKELPEHAQTSHHHSKPKLLMLGLVIVLLIAGIAACAYLLGKNNSSEQIAETEITSPSPTPSTDPTANWKTYKSSGSVTNCVPILNDWNSFQCKTGVTPAFSIKYPSEWHMENTVFYDENDKKIAEFSPGSFELPDGRKCFDREFVSERGGKLISENKISFGNYQGIKRIFSSFFEGNGNGIWYPNSYCLENGKNAFLINFYESSLDSEKTNLFDQILSTFTFTDSIPPSSSNTSNQETYANDIYDFSFDYPSSYTLVDNLPNSDINPIPPAKNILLTDSNGRKLNIWVNPGGFGPFFSTTKHYEIAYSNDKGIFVTEEEILPKNKYQSDSLNEILTNQDNTLNGHNLFFSFTYNKNDLNAEEDFKKILSTFKLN